MFIIYAQLHTVLRTQGYLMLKYNNYAYKDKRCSRLVGFRSNKSFKLEN